MKTKKISAYVALLIIILSSSFACSDSDSYSLGDFRITIATVIPEGQSSYSLLLDNGDRLWPAASDVFYKPYMNQRVFVNYTILSDKIDGFDHYIKVNDIWNILTKPVISLTEENVDSIGNDPVKMNDLWIGGDYLNAAFSFNYSGEKPHAINMVRNKIKASSGDVNQLELEFKHNAYKSRSNVLFDGFACFDLKPFRIDGKDSIPIIIKVKNWEGIKEYKLMYKYNEMNKSKQQATIPTITSNEYK